MDRRTDNRAGRREWNIADNLRGNSGGTAQEHSDNLPVCTGGHDKLLQRSIIRGDSDSDDRVRDICRGGVAEDTDNVCKARRGS